MLPNNEEYDLAPKNGHPRAQSILVEPFYWDCTDDEAPLGNDTGADVFSIYGEALVAGGTPTDLSFIDQIMQEWGFDFAAWQSGQQEALQLYDADRYAFEAANDAAIAFAFGMLIVKGKISSEAIALASAAILRELHPEILSMRWVNPESRKPKLLSMLSVLG